MSDSNPKDLPDVWQHIARERRQIGYDLHDGLLQQIIGAGMLLEALRYRIVGGYIATEKDVVHISKILEEAIAEGRALIRKLEFNDLEQLEPLPILLSRWLESAKKQTEKIVFRLHIAPELNESLALLSPQVAGHLLAIVREASANIMKHSKATKAEVSLRSAGEGHRALLAIVDNGRGLDIGELWDEDLKDHFGLVSMRHRANAIGGTFELKSEPGKGTTVQIEFSLQETSLIGGSINPRTSDK